MWFLGKTWRSKNTAVHMPRMLWVLGLNPNQGHLFFSHIQCFVACSHEAQILFIIYAYFEWNKLVLQNKLALHRACPDTTVFGF